MSFLSFVLTVVLAHCFSFHLSPTLAKWQAWLFVRFESGKQQDAWFTLGVALSPLFLLALFNFWVIHLSFWVALVFNVFVLWMAMDFFPYYRHFLRMLKDLSTQRLESAKDEHARFTGEDAACLSVEELSSRTLKSALIHAHVHFFAPFFFFVLFGASGAFFYALLFQLSQKTTEKESQLNLLCARLFRYVDYIPARLTAFSFALMGNFEPAFSTSSQFGLKSALPTSIVEQSGFAALSASKECGVESLLQGESLVGRVFLLWLSCALVLLCLEVAKYFLMF